jgi:glycosyltransferase involved in cell wall biosynthesis
VSRFCGPTSTFLYNVLDIPEQKKIILSVGRNHEKKGYDYGIKAMSLLVKRLDNKDAHYVIVGRGVSEHQSLVDELHANEYVSLIEEVPPEKITQCYKSADIFFSPSIVEGLSLVSIEAMASGLPLVVTDVPGNEDIVKANHCGVIVNSENVESMTEGLYRLLSDKPYTEELASIALSSSKKYDWSKIAEQYESVYSKAVEEHRVNGN